MFCYLVIIEKWEYKILFIVTSQPCCHSNQIVIGKLAQWCLFVRHKGQKEVLHVRQLWESSPECYMKVRKCSRKLHEGQEGI